MNNNNNNNNFLYRVVRPIAKGEFGSVVLIAPKWTSRLMIIKMLAVDAQETSDTENTWLRFMRLQHVPHTVHSLGAVFVRRDALPDDLRAHAPCLEEGQKYLLIFMPYVEGNTLRETLGAQTGPLSRERIRTWSAQITAFCFGAYHHFGMTHNDLKLGNILIASSNSAPCVIDFTFAVCPATDWNQITWPRGTLCYMAPEKLFFTHGCPSYCQVSPATLACSDVWSIGTIMSTMALTGLPVPVSPAIDAAELKRVSDKHGCFSPFETDSLYHMLPATRPWFRPLVVEMAQSSGCNAEWIEQAVRLLLWTRALHFRSPRDPGRTGYRLPTNEFMPGIEQSPLYAVVSRYTPGILNNYDADGLATYERVRDALELYLGPEMFAIYLNTQSWRPTTRIKSLANPFAHLLTQLDNTYSTAATTATTVRYAPDISIWPSLREFLDRCTASPCGQCGGPSRIHCDLCNDEYSRACDTACFSRMHHTCKTILAKK